MKNIKPRRDYESKKNGRQYSVQRRTLAKFNKVFEKDLSTLTLHVIKEDGYFPRLP
jgi:hypothetical protein